MCPNLGECWGRGTATFLLMGDTCTRSCGFCEIKTGRGGPLDPDEPRPRVAESIQAMGLSHAVLTSVNRDEQPDGGAWVFAESIYWIRQLQPLCTIEVLIPDFRGDWAALQAVMDARPEILNHNTETVPRPLPYGAPASQVHAQHGTAAAGQADGPEALTKSGIMLGLGETWDEILQVMDDLRAHDVDIMTIGQYLAAEPLPSADRALLHARRVCAPQRRRRAARLPLDGIRPARALQLSRRWARHT